MTSRFAKNFVFNRQGQVRYLEVNGDGQPLQGQVPLTYQTYSGTGNTTLVYDGSDVVVVTSTLSAGALTIDCSAMQNYYGRTVKFLAYHQLTNDVVIDFGAGDVYVPPSTTASSTFTFQAADTPCTASWTFISTQIAVMTSSTTISSVGPRTLNFKWSTDAANDLNDGTAQQISWVNDNTQNNTTLTLGGGTAAGTYQNFTVVTPGPYTVTHQEFIISDPSIAYRSWVSIVNLSSIWSFTESSLGLTGQRTGGSVTLDLDVGDIIAVYIGNAAGAVTPVTPLDATYGTLSIIQHVY